MGRFDIYRNPGRNKASIPYLIDVQSNVISGLSTRIVAPLRSLAGFSAVVLPPDLFPIISVEGSDYFRSWALFPCKNSRLKWAPHKPTSLRFRWRWIAYSAHIDRSGRAALHHSTTGTSARSW
jgi:toxin CcdB